jgi:hypothetical protein
MKDNWNFQKAIMYICGIILICLADQEITLLKVIAAAALARILLLEK